MLEESRKMQLSEQVKDFLLCQYARGESSWNEEGLAKQFSVSRTPIRDVLYELEKQRIIIRRHKRGIVLRKPSAREISEVYEVRAALERLAVGRAVGRVTAEDIRALKRMDRELGQAVRKKDVFLVDQLDMKFHAKLIEISGNEYLKTMIDQFDLLIRSFQIGSRFHVPAEPPADPEHGKIIEALEQGDKRTCMRLIRRHIDGARRFLVKQVTG